MREIASNLIRHSEISAHRLVRRQTTKSQPLRRHITTIHSNLTDVQIDIFRTQAFVPQLPILIRCQDRTDSAKIAVATGIPAIHKWFREKEVRVDDDLISLQEEYFEPFKSTVLPFELVTPIFNNQDGQDILEDFTASRPLSLSQYLPRSNVTLGELLRDCARAEREELAGPEISRSVEENPSSSLLNANPGEPLTEFQVELLRRHAPRFQQFHSFHAPLELMISASRRTHGSVLNQLPGLYIAQAQIADLPEELRKDLPTPGLVSEAGKGDVYDANVWIGTPPTFTPLHKDPNPNLFLQLSSSKKVRLIEPRKGHAIFAAVQRKIGASSSAAFRGEEMMQGRERVELKNAVWNAANKDGYEVTVEPGDALFIPKGWWHSIKSAGIGLNASVNWWFR